MPANAEAQQGSKVPERDLEACLGPTPAHALLHVLPLQTCTAQLARCTASLPGLDSFHDCLNQHGKLVAAPVGSWLPRTAQLLEVGADMPTSLSVSALRDPARVLRAKNIRLSCPASAIAPLRKVVLTVSSLQRNVSTFLRLAT